MIPAWDIAGLLPPIWPGEEGHSSRRSPYECSIVDVVERFGSSRERRVILRGLLAYRAALGGLGITVGFQWLNGSFMQEVETTEDRPPNDIDVVTYIAIPEGATQASLMEQAPYLFRSKLSKPIYRVDAYVLPFLNRQVSGKQIERVTYWYSMWSHTRETNTWKGFVLTALSPDDDAVASALLNQQDLEGADDDQPE